MRAVVVQELIGPDGASLIEVDEPVGSALAHARTSGC